MANEELVWRTSTHCGGGNCVEVTFVDESVWVRDSFDQNGQKLVMSAETWSGFLGEICRPN